VDYERGIAMARRANKSVSATSQIPAMDNSKPIGSLQKERPSALTLQSLRGIVPAIPGRAPSDFEDQIEEAMEEEAARVVAGMRGE
jgi:hypothetical protein